MAGYGFKDIAFGSDPRYRGTGTLSSSQTGSAVTRANGSPGAARFTVHDQTSGRRVFTGVSNPDGSWTVSNLNPERFYSVRVVDRTGQLNGAVLDWMKPTVL